MKPLVIVAAVALALPVLAHSETFFSLEARVGESRFPDMGNGVWYENGPAYPHTLNLHSPAVEVGVTGTIVPHLDWHLDYAYLGTVRATATIDGDDSNYNAATGTCYAPCATNDRMVSRGSVQGIYATLEPNYTLPNGVRVGIEAGPFLFRPTWTTTTTVASGQQFTYTHNPRLQIGAVIGVNVSWKNFEISYQYFMDRTRGDNIPGIWKNTQLISVGYKW